jgi:hypothetical protein
MVGGDLGGWSCFGRRFVTLLASNTQQQCAVPSELHLVRQVFAAKALLVKHFSASVQ